VQKGFYTGCHFLIHVTKPAQFTTIVALTEWSTVDAGNTMDAGRRFRLFPFFLFYLRIKLGENISAE
jgi:hypothetical protein